MASSEIIAQIAKNCRRSFAGIMPHNFDFDRMAREFVSEERAREELELLKKVLGTDLKEKKLLELGSGYGMVVAAARHFYGIDAYGVEPSEQFCGTVEASRRLLREIGEPVLVIRKGQAEAIPFDDSSFDVVYSSNVLEHVRDPQKAFSEAVRVLKPRGFLVFVIPNYGSWWEGHYGIMMLPHSPPWLLKIMVRFLGRDPTFVDTLQFVTFRKLGQWLKPLSERVKILDWGQQIWVERLRSLEFSEWAHLRSLKRIVKLAGFLRLVGPIIALGIRLHWETPFVLVAQKNPQ